MENMAKGGNLRDGLTKGETTVEDLIRADGFAILATGLYHESGVSPGQQTVQDIVAWLKEVAR